MFCKIDQLLKSALYTVLISIKNYLTVKRQDIRALDARVERRCGSRHVVSQCALYLIVGIAHQPGKTAQDNRKGPARGPWAVARVQAIAGTWPD